MNDIIAGLKEHGVVPKQTWLQRILDEGLTDKDRIFLRVLCSDITETNEPTVISAHLQDARYNIEDAVFLQINEIVDISLPLEDRKDFKQSAKGTLKMFLQDSKRSFIGISKETITKVDTTIKPGSKIKIIPPAVMKYGVIFLTDTNFHCFFGSSPTLIEKRTEIFSRGKRTRSGRINNQLQIVAEQPNQHDIHPPVQIDPPRNQTPPPIENNRSSPEPVRSQSLSPRFPSPPVVELDDDDDEFSLGSESDIESFSSLESQYRNTLEYLTDSDSDVVEVFSSSSEKCSIKELIHRSAFQESEFLVDGKIIVVNDLHVSDSNRYVLTCVLSDDNDSLDIMVSHQIVDKILGVPAELWNSITEKERNDRYQHLMTQLMNFQQAFKLQDSRANCGKYILIGPQVQ